MPIYPSISTIGAGATMTAAEQYTALAAAAEWLQGDVQNADVDDDAVLRDHVYRPNVYGFPTYAFLGQFCDSYERMLNPLLPQANDGVDDVDTSTFDRANLRDDFAAVLDRVYLHPRCLQPRGSEQVAVVPGMSVRAYVGSRYPLAGIDQGVEISFRASVYVAQRYVSEPTDASVATRPFAYPGSVRGAGEDPPDNTSNAGHLRLAYRRVLSTQAPGSATAIAESKRRLYSHMHPDISGVSEPSDAQMLATHLQHYSIETYAEVALEPGVYDFWVEWVTDDDLARYLRCLVFAEAALHVDVFREEP